MKSDTSNSNALRSFAYNFSHSRKYRELWNIFYKVLTPIFKFGIVAKYPTIYLFYAKHFKPDHYWTAPNMDTELLVEAAGSSASAGFANYMKKHNPGIKLAYSCEVSATVKYAVKNKIPTIVLTRNILDVVNSGLTRFPHCTSRNILKHYYFFHKEILPLRKKFILVDFHVVRTNPQEVVEQINEMYGTNFNIGDNDLPKTRGTQSTYDNL